MDERNAIVEKHYSNMINVIFIVIGLDMMITFSGHPNIGFILSFVAVVLSVVAIVLKGVGELEELKNSEMLEK
jgi:hypothetical protein